MNYTEECRCGLTECLISCCYNDPVSTFDAETAPLAEVFDKVDEQIEIYKKMPSGRERNIYRHHISKLVKTANDRGLKINKVAPFKTFWWI